MFYVSLASLMIVFALCVLGSVYQGYSDNLLQRAGMAALAFGIWPRMELLVERQDVYNAGLMPGAQTLIHVGLAAFAVGTAVKVWKHRPKKPPPQKGVHRQPWAG